MELHNGIEKKSRHRSPNYPSITLQKGMELAKTLFEVHGRHAAPLEVAARDWGVSATSSYTAQQVAALAAYGLVDVEGTKEAKRVKVSDLAFNIFIDRRPDSRDRCALIKEAALRPDIFRKLYDAYPDRLPVDHALEYELVKEYKFNPKSVLDFISILRATLDFAKVYEPDILEAELFPNEEGKMIAAPDKTPVKEAIPLPVDPIRIKMSMDEREIANYPIGQGLKARILISGKSPLTQKAIEKLVALLNLNKEDLQDLPEVGDDEENRSS
jgi:antitoxin component HigA of HigAB toxin-antitoxin module